VSGPLVPTKEFDLDPAITFLDCGYSHPISRRARDAAVSYLDFRASGRIHALNTAELRREVLAGIARLIGADPGEVALVQSTTAAENAVVAGLGLTGSAGGRVVTDATHFAGSLYLYERLRDRGVDVEVLPSPHTAADLERALDVPTDLLAVSLVSNIDGHRLDLDQVCAIAHHHGALVYADVIQAVGAVPFDVRTSGVDFCAASSFKWLMGDFGVGFAYRSRAVAERFTPTVAGYAQLDGFEHRPDADPPLTWRRRDDATGDFGVGSVALGAVAQLRESLQLILDLGVEVIASHRAVLLDRLREGLDAADVPVLTPREQPPSPLLAIAPVEPVEAAERVGRAGFVVTSDRRRLRVGPSVFNHLGEIDRFLDVLRG
jgi:selenocysteine lyase/cysteine desulfurase